MDAAPTRTVLLVDDEPDLRRLGLLSLEAFGGWIVIEAESAVGLQDVVARERPDVVLLDVMMPKVDGLTALAALRADPRTRDVPVIIVTAKDSLAEDKRYRALGAVGMISKPFNPLTLAHLVARLLDANLSER